MIFFYDHDLLFTIILRQHCLVYDDKTTNVPIVSFICLMLYSNDTCIIKHSLHKIAVAVFMARKYFIRIFLKNCLKHIFRHFLLLNVVV